MVEFVLNGLYASHAGTALFGSERVDSLGIFRNTKLDDGNSPISAVIEESELPCGIFATCRTARGTFTEARIDLAFDYFAIKQFDSVCRILVVAEMTTV
jgi:hypothetical protein